MLDVLIIGTGQAGLAAAYFLKQKGIPLMLIDKAKALGDSWRNRYDSLQLFTPRNYSRLPGLDLPGDPNGLPTKDEVAAYLSEYALTFDFPIQLDTEVKSLTSIPRGFEVETSRGTIQSKNVIVATGPFHKPYVPALSQSISNDTTQLHSSAYRNPGQLTPGSVLVVGAGNSGAQIAVELSNDFDVYLSASNQLHFKPLYILGKSIFWYYDKLGFLQAGNHTKRGKWLRQQPEQIYGYQLKQRLKEGKIKLFPRAASAESRTVFFADDQHIEADNIIWATGFRPDFSWIQINHLFNEHQEVTQFNGISNIPGLYFIGLPWLSCRGSALLGWVQHDARRIAEYINNDLKSMQLFSPGII
ncbi:flavin-containing monooxygenase [Paenibacillus cineris]|uniref:flavin-containing monooxygenase n=1 Tax=Paenibacillus cineris TaxID=237530 RepID=UPI001AFE99AF|nr:NAD(P)/FAD-dependent oxidoreductase [Paenibacillus cineris]GIO61501.1 putative oxidoreductase CzcO [Paenibacillus cineris]